MKKLILLLCATLSSVATPGNLSAAHKAPAQPREVQSQDAQAERVYTAVSYDSFIQLLHSFDTNIRIANRRVPSLSLVVADIKVLCDELARILFHVSKENSIDQIKFLHRELLGILGDVHLSKKSVSVSVVREARTTVTDWAQAIAKKLIKNEAALRDAKIDPAHAQKVLKSLKTKLAQRIFNPAFAVYKNRSEKLYDRCVAQPLEWAEANLHIVIPAAVAAGFAAWMARDLLRDAVRTLGTAFAPYPYTTEYLPCLKQGGEGVANCGVYAMFHADRLLRDEELQGDATRTEFTAFHQNATADITEQVEETYATMLANDPNSNIDMAQIHADFNATQGHYISSDNILHVIKKRFPQSVHDLHVIEIARNAGNGVVQALSLPGIDTGFLTESDRNFIKAAAEFQSSTRNNMVVLATDGGHWIAVKLSRDTANKVVLDVADSVGGYGRLANSAASYVMHPRIREVNVALSNNLAAANANSVVGGNP